MARTFVFVLAAMVLEGCSGDTKRFSPEMRGDTVIVRGEPTCEECRIVFSDSMTIGADADSVSLSPDTWIARRKSDGHVFATGAYGSIGVVEYDQTGRFLRLLGKQGAGPAEFGAQPSRPTILRGDTLVVYDLKLRRFMRIAPDGTFLGPFSPGFRPWDVRASPDGTLLVTGALPTNNPAQQGPPAHFLRLDGSVIRSVGDPMGPVGDRSAPYKKVAMSRAGSIALANFSGYDITIHYADGTRRVLSRKADWFVATPAPYNQQPHFGSMWFDGEERLWTNVYVPIVPEAGTEIDTRDELSSRIQTSHNYVEVFDSRSGELLASHRFDTPSSTMDGLAMAPFERPSGFIGQNLWRVSLQRPAAGREAKD